MKNHVIKTAKAIIKEKGIMNLYRMELCERAGIPDGSFSSIMGCSFNEFLCSFNNSTSLKHYKVIKSRVASHLRRDYILMAAVEVSLLNGFQNITRLAVANKSGICESSVSKYFGTMNQLKRSVMRYAVKNEILKIIAQGLVVNDKQAVKAPQHIITKAIESI